MYKVSTTWAGFSWASIILGTAAPGHFALERVAIEQVQGLRKVGSVVASQAQTVVRGERPNVVRK